MIVVDVKKRGACLEVFTERGREKDFDAGKRMAWRGRYWRGLIVAGIMAAELEGHVSLEAPMGENGSRGNCGAGGVCM